MYYLIEHNRTTKATSWTEYLDYSIARIAAAEKEYQHLLINQHEMEVVIFEANSIDELKRTHSRYFVAEQKDQPAGALLAIGLVSLAIYLLNKK